jgi:sugar phosphate isomerase/epimerase
MELTRREMFMTAASAMALPAAAPRPTVALFSKPLPELNYNDLGKTARELGFDGVDLTVRTKGHVLPARVEEDLPRAIEALAAHGLSTPMITTELTSASDPTARPVLSTAARMKVRYFKMGYWRYRDADPEQTPRRVREDARGLAELAKEFGIEAGWHNHSGDYVGHTVWDARSVLADLDPKWIGYYFDLSHATAEGGVTGWQIALRLALPRMKLVAVKDHRWERVGGKRIKRNCPLGEGLVDFPKAFSMLAKGGFGGVISLHIEYETPDVKATIAKDLAFVKQQIARSY